MRPPSIFSRWLMQRSSVVLPEPLGPITTTTCFRFTERSTPSSTVRRPKRLTICSARTISRPFPLDCCISSFSLLLLTHTAFRGTQSYHAHGKSPVAYHFIRGSAIGVHAIFNPVLDVAPEAC